MYTKEFLILLRKIAPKFDWSEDASNSIRAVLKDSEEDTTDFCPITAACFVNKKKKFSVGNYDEAGAKLGMGERVRDKIVNAADNWDEEDLRLLLKKAVGLAE